MVNEADLEKCIKLGVDGIIVSNHGGRQIDAGESTISSLQKLIRTDKERLTIMLDGGVRSGVDIARAMPCGADFVFMAGPSCMGPQHWVKTGEIIP